MSLNINTLNVVILRNALIFTERLFSSIESQQRNDAPNPKN